MNSSNLNRRDFLKWTSLGITGGFASLTPVLAAEKSEPWDPNQAFIPIGQPLKVIPVIIYRLPVPKKETSWKSWGGVQTEAAVQEEMARINGELKQLVNQSGFPLEIAPVVPVTTAEDIARIDAARHDTVLVFACTGSGELLRSCLALRPDALIFVRHKSGPVYYWYEALSVRFLRSNKPGQAAVDPNLTNAHVEDVVVDDYSELRWRLQALFAVKNLLGSRIVALGGPWGKYSPEAPRIAEERYRFKIIDVAYEDFEPRLKRARENAGILAEAEQATNRFLSLPGTVLNTERRFVVNAFILHRLFKELMQEHDASVFTIKSCMGTIMPMAQTTACLSLALLNDEGPMAFCESDFVIIPAGILLRYISGKPVFLHNSTFPHQAMVTCAHCTCPRRLNGQSYAPARIVTHYESDFGASPKVDMPVQQEVTFIDPEYSTRRWLGFSGFVKSNPFYEICRSQQDVEIQGDWKRLVQEARDSHWVMVYGQHLREAGYALRKLGMEWVNVSETV